MRIILIFCKFLSFILRKIGRGSTYPGHLAYKLSKRITHYFKLPSLVIAVTGSAGKGSTTKIIAETLEKNGKKVIYNITGSNMLPGIISLFIEKCDMKGRLNCDALVLEVDERYSKDVFEMVNPDYVIVTNVSRDQPPRHGDFDIVLDKIKGALNSNMHLILNGDDPYIRKLDLDDSFKKTYYGIERNNLSYKDNVFNSLNMSYCPKCHSKLKYNYYNFDMLGDYYCEKCDFKRPVIDYCAKEINLDDKYMIVNGNNIKIAFNIIYYAYNILAAYTVCSLIGIDEKKITENISSMKNNKKINERYKYNGRNVYVLNNKNENNLTFNESVLFAYNKKTPRLVVIGWKEISRRYEHNDMSWLYDIEFELLNDEYTTKVICAGRDRYDIATRMKYAGFSKDKIMICTDLSEAKDVLKKSEADIFAILNFDYIEPFNKVMRER